MSFSTQHRHNAMLSLLPLFFLALAEAEAGHYLIWLPTLSKSVKIGVVEVGLALGNNNNSVTCIQF